MCETSSTGERTIEESGVAIGELIPKLLHRKQWMCWTSIEKGTETRKIPVDTERYENLIGTTSLIGKVSQMFGRPKKNCIQLMELGFLLQNTTRFAYWT
ncbi:hypothetical protein [Halorussus pelagicus]|uniref:hypothetical protein n=1 Tax=Halorussus pelagicus TaxID=2505977 RepID=UPI000FFC5982|nr:hypothetical protein [Halorussus pelagicus]